MTKAIGRRNRVEDVTAEQYAMAWRLVAANCTIPQVLAGAGITKNQLVWLMREGDRDRGMPAFGPLLLEQVAAVRGQAQEAAKFVGDRAMMAIKSQAQIVDVAQKIIMFMFQEMAADITANNKLNPGDPSRKPLHRLVPSRQTTDTLKVLRLYADYGWVAESLRAVFDGPGSARDLVTDLPRDARDGLSPESMMPAATSLLADTKGEERTGDPLEDLLPEYRGWTRAELEEFAGSGTRPLRDFGAGEGLDE